MIGMNAKLTQIQDWIALAQKAEWSVSKLAKNGGVSVRTLERNFLETHGKMPKAWLAAQRQKLAWELLCECSSVKETASELGYRHAEHFSRDFKACYGYCPTERCNRCGRAGNCPKRNGDRLDCQ
jgi:AraC family transcriptional regulator, transcriptional activator FtrA